MPDWTWTWDQDDFAALWYSDAYDRFPRPLRYRSRFTLNDEMRAHEIQVRERYSREERAAIQVALDALGQSAVRIEILGRTTVPDRGSGPEAVRTYRIVGARTDTHAVTMSQVGSGDDFGSIRVRLCHPEDLPGRITSAFPGRPPGTAGPETFERDDIASRPEQFENPQRTRARDRYRRLVDRPADGGGYGILRVGHYANLADPLRRVQWHDIIDDGRYVEHRGPTITVRPAAAQDLTRIFTTWLDHAWRNIEAERTVL